jgi:hypothetical protein
MGLRRSENRNGSRFTRGVALAIRDRFLRRVERIRKSPQRQSAPTWAYSVIRNKSKMASRLFSGIQEDQRNSPWEYLITDQKEKLWRLVDPYRRWMKREAYILDEMNRGEFRQEPIYVLGFAWGYCADLQRQKLQVTQLPGRPNDRKRWPGWNGVKNRVCNRISRLVEDPAQLPDSWDYVIGGISRKLHGTLSLRVNWSHQFAKY